MLKTVESVHANCDADVQADFCPAQVVSHGPKSQKCFWILGFLHSVSNLLGFELVKVQVSGIGSGVQLIQVIVTSNAGAWLSNATLKFFSLAEPCHTQIF